MLFKKYILQLLLDDEHDLAIVVDSDNNYDPNLIRRNYVACTLPNLRSSFYNDIYLKKVSPELPKENLCGMWTGLLKVAGKLKPDVREILDNLLQQDEIRQQGRMPDLINELNKSGYPVHIIYITGHWMNIDDIKDLIEAGSF